MMLVSYGRESSTRAYGITFHIDGNPRTGSRQQREVAPPGGEAGAGPLAFEVVAALVEQLALDVEAAALPDHVGARRELVVGPRRAGRGRRLGRAPAVDRRAEPEVAGPRRADHHPAAERGAPVEVA